MTLLYPDVQKEFYFTNVTTVCFPCHLIQPIYRESVCQAEKDFCSTSWQCVC